MGQTDPKSAFAHEARNSLSEPLSRVAVAVRFDRHFLFLVTKPHLPCGGGCVRAALPFTANPLWMTLRSPQRSLDGSLACPLTCAWRAKPDVAGNGVFAIGVGGAGYDPSYRSLLLEPPRSRSSPQWVQNRNLGFAPHCSRFAGLVGCYARRYSDHGGKHGRERLGGLGSSRKRPKSIPRPRIAVPGRVRITSRPFGGAATPCESQPSKRSQADAARSVVVAVTLSRSHTNRHGPRPATRFVQAPGPRQNPFARVSCCPFAGQGQPVR
jgi:hypothetical protein